MTGGTTLTQVGSDVTGLAYAPATNHWGSNQVVEYRGRLYFVHTGAGSNAIVSRYNPVTDAWDIVFTSPNTATGQGSGKRTGLFIANFPPRMFFFDFQDGVGDRLFYTDDGTSWTSGATISTTAQLGRAVLYRNKLYIPRTSNVMDIVDPALNTITRISNVAASSPNSGGMCVFRNRLYQVAQGGSSGDDQVLYEFTGGAWVSRATLLAVSSGAGTPDECYALAPIGNTKMVAITIGSTDGTNTTRGSRAFDLTPTGPTSFTVTDVTTPVIPSGLRAPQTATSQRWTTFVDNQTSPGSPAVFFWHLSSATAGTYSYYEYVDSSTELSPGSAGPNQDVVVPYLPNGGGDRIWDGSGSLDAIATNAVASPTLGHSRLTALCSGDTAGAGGMRTSVRLATIAALPANTPAGAGVGKTLTGNANGALSVDGTAVVNGDRILVKDEVAAANNGIYTVTDQGSGGAPFILTRATDFDQVSATEVAAGAWVRVTAGGTLSNTFWQMNQTATITIETTALTWAQLTTRFLRFWYSPNENANLVQGTLGGTPSGQAGQLTRNVNTIEGVIADGATTFTFDWNAGGDGQQNGAPEGAALRIGTT
jgi:hypothetical protein